MCILSFLGCGELSSLCALSISAGHIQEPKCYITKRRLDFDCHAAQSQPHAPSSNFFSPKRRRQSNFIKESGSRLATYVYFLYALYVLILFILNVGIATDVGTHNAWNASNDFTCVSNVMQGTCM